MVRSSSITWPRPWRIAARASSPLPAWRMVTGHSGGSARINCLRAIFESSQTTSGITAGEHLFAWKDGGGFRQAEPLRLCPRGLFGRALQPCEYALGGTAAAGKAGGQQVAAGWRFPVEHFPGAEGAGQGLEHQLRGQLLEGYAAGRADGFIQRPWADQLDGQGLDRAGQL